MDVKQLTSVQMKHEGRIGKLEQKTEGQEKLFTKHVNRHFQMLYFAIAQTLMIIGIFAAVMLR